VRNGAAAGLIDCTVRLPIRVVAPIQCKVSPITATELSALIIDAAVKANQNLGRADNTNLNGFNMIDLAWLARLNSVYGCCMDQCLIKLCLLHKCLAWDNPWNTLPQAQVGIIDQFTQPSPVNNPVVTYNDGNNFGENLGGVAAVLAMNGGSTGTVAFHLTKETVPLTEWSSVLFIPASLLNSDGDVNIGLALIYFILMWAPFPTGLWGVIINTLDSAGGNAADQLFTSLASTVFVPGMTRLHIILPRKTTAVNPRNQPDANNLALLQPRTGSRPSASFPIGSDPLNVNFVSGALIDYNLAELIYTWANDMDITSLANYLEFLAAIVGVNDSLERVSDIVAHTTEWYPMLTQALSNNNVFFAANSNAQFAGTDCRCTSFEPTRLDWPQPGNERGDYLVYETEVVAWNKVATGLCAPAESVNNDDLPEWVGNVLSVFWAQLHAMSYAVVWNSHYANLGLASQTWDDAFLNNHHPEYRRQVRKYYAAQARLTREPSNAMFGPMMADYYAALTARRPGTTPKCTVKATIFDMICPPRGTYISVIDDDGNLKLGFCPSNLPDIWIQYFSQTLPKWQATFPLPNGPDSLCGFYQGLVPMQIAGSLHKGGLIDPKYNRNALEGNETPDESDEMRWNERVMYFNSDATPRHNNDGVYPASHVFGFLVKQRPITPTWFMAPIPSNLPIANTLNIPMTNDIGELIFAIALAADAARMRNALYRKSRLATYGWQLRGMVAWNTTLAQDKSESKSAWSSYEASAIKSEGKESASQPTPPSGGEALLTRT
jgi:hypothetical protein